MIANASLNTGYVAAHVSRRCTDPRLCASASNSALPAGPHGRQNRRKCCSFKPALTAVVHSSQGHYAEAEPLCRRALAICEKALGPDHPYTAIAARNYAALLRSLKRQAEA